MLFNDTLVKDTLDLETPVQKDWKSQLTIGSIVEVWVHGQISFAHVQSLYERGIIADLVSTSSGQSAVKDPAKVSFGEIISVWPLHLIAPSPTSLKHLVCAVDDGFSMLKFSASRSIDLSKVYGEMRRMPKKDPRSSMTSPAISDFLFRSRAAQTAERRVALTVATAVLVANDSIRFKRSTPGLGWRALPPSVTLSRGRCSFIDACKSILEPHKYVNASKHPTIWSREQLDILRDLEIVAASGTTACGVAATSLEELGYPPNDDGAATLLLDINYWATGPTGRSSAQLPHKRIIDDIHSVRNGSRNPTKSLDTELADARKQGARVIDAPRDDKEWTFSPQLLAEARDLRAAARDRRRNHMEPKGYVTHGGRRRNLLNPPEGHEVLKAYCIDDKSSRFLDDAISIQVLENGSVIRLWLHIADVDEIVHSGSAIDDFAKERGQSLYLPLKPLHMLPAAAMDAASFSTSFATEAITVMIEYDVREEAVQNWEVFSSVVPPVKRINYEQFDVALERGAKAAQLDNVSYDDLCNIAWVAPLLADKLDTCKSRRKQRSLQKADADGASHSTGTAELSEERSIASVRLIKKADKTGVRGGSRSVKVINFLMTRSHLVVDDVLTSAGGLIRQFARENRACLPEDRDAMLFVARCGTAPLRRYSDLATQRQVKCVLFGRQPAGKRRMEELRLWLAKRQTAGEKTVADRRRAALFVAFSSFCSERCLLTGSERAIVRGQARSVMMTKRGVLRIDLTLDGTGLTTTATLADYVLSSILGVHDNDAVSGSESKNEGILRRARMLLRPYCNVSVEISKVDTVGFSIEATVVEVMK